MNKETPPPRPPTRINAGLPAARLASDVRMGNEGLDENRSRVAQAVFVAKARSKCLHSEHGSNRSLIGYMGQATVGSRVLFFT